MHGRVSVSDIIGSELESSKPDGKYKECLNGENIKPRNDSGPNKEEPAPRGMNQNTLHVNAVRSDVHQSTQTEQSIKDLSQNSLNTGVQATSMKSTSNMGKNSVEKNQISPKKAKIKALEVSIPRVSRATEPKLKPLSSMLPKGSLSMRNKEQGLELQGKTVLKRNPSVDTKKQLPPTPTLKRKTFEESTEKPRLAPIKRLSASPCMSYDHSFICTSLFYFKSCLKISFKISNDIGTSSEKAVGQQIRNRATMADKKSPRVDSSLTEIDIYSASENDTIFDMAEAYSKELDDMCNMLKQKHDEAKDIIVRAEVARLRMATIEKAEAGKILKFKS